jgi:hypothetical protein
MTDSAAPESKNPLSSEPYRVEAIGPADKRFSQVIDLWGRDRKTLGLFPEGAFETRAQAGQLLVASTQSGTILGYVAYRKQRRLNCAVVIHLCVASNARGRNVSDALWGALRNAAESAGCDSVRLKCRRDFEHASRLWRRLGLVPRADCDGRSKTGSELTLWVYSLRPDNLPLFSEQVTDDRLKAVIDANVFYDLHARTGNRDEESLVLLGPWMDEAVSLHVVDEIHAEINRRDDREEREVLHRKAQDYRELHGDDAGTEKALADLRVILGEAGRRASSLSDRRQLARAIAGGADVFLTRDGGILAKAEEIETRLKLRVMTPAELSCTLDEAERAHAFQPARLASTHLIEREARAEDIEGVASALQAACLGEKQGRCARLIRLALAKRRSSTPTSVRVVWEEQNNPVTAVATTCEPNVKRTTVSLLRVASGPLEKTLCRHLILALVRENHDRGFRVIVVTDPYLTPSALEALRELHFTRDEKNQWQRRTPAVVATRQQLIGALGGELPTGMAASSLEERFWPAKILGEGVPTYIIPIKPTWAAQLFDRALASHELFGAFARLALNREQVYYRSARLAGLAAPARLLWYVSKGDATSGGMMIRACSRLLSFEVGQAKTLYRRYQRLGIYGWREIAKTAGGDASADIMAVRFADSEPFPRPVPVDLLRNLGIRSQFQSPTKISEDQFTAIYRHGMML